VASKVSDVAGKVANIAGKAVNILSNPEKAIGDFVKGAAGKFLDKLPFNLGNMIKPFAEKLIDNGLSFLSKGVVGSAFEFAKKLAPKVDQLADFAEAVKKGADKVDAFADGVAGQASQSNVQNIFSAAQAENLIARYAA
jgi:hypothetical protein